MANAQQELTQITPPGPVTMQLRKEATSHDLYDSILLVHRAFPLENMKLGKLSFVDEVAYV